MRDSKDYCKLVDVFYGNGEVDHFAEDGLASKWFYIKALSGNTIPHATLPFGRISVGPYSGGYPCGYGTHYPNCCGGIKKLSDFQTIRGFSHFHHSGVGGISYYFNYAITTPFYGDISEIEIFHELKDEKGKPGYYSASMNGITAEFSVSGPVALHRYHFGKSNGRIAIDFSNDGLHKLFGKRYHGTVIDALIKCAGNKVLFSGIFSGIKLYFCVEFIGENVKTSLFDNNCIIEGCEASAEQLDNNFGAVADFDGNDISLKFSYSTISFEESEKNLASVSDNLDEAAKKAYEIWNEYLSAVKIETEDEELEKRFYSNLYHSIVKPCDLSGEQILGVKGDVVTGIATFWDQYKTLFPLIYMLYPQMGEKLAKAIINISRTKGHVPCAFDMTNIATCEDQGKLLAGYCLCDAYHSGVKTISPELIDEYLKREFETPDFEEFFENGVFKNYTHIVDVTDVCRNAAAITEDEDFRKYLLKLADNWSNAYDDDGLMSEKSDYYEGDRYTYSFRLLSNMNDRIELAGGKEKFIEMLDSFFGFGKESLKQLTYIGAEKEIDASRHHRFEGFNNECDMETPYAYIYAGRNDRTCEIVHAAITQSFLSGVGGLPGNNDSGGLSSCYIWNVLGIFPAAGQGEFLIGSPHIDNAVLNLSSGKKLEIAVNRKTNGGYITESAFFNGKEITDFRVKTKELLKGGKLVINIK